MKTTSGTWPAPLSGVAAHGAFARMWREVVRLGKAVANGLERRPLLQGCLLCLTTAAGLALCMRSFYWMVPTVEGWAIYWPFNGIVIAVLLMTLRRRWPWIIAGALLTFAVEEISMNDPLTEAVVDILGNITEILIGAFILPSFWSLKQWLLEPYLVARFAVSIIFIGPAAVSLPVAYFFHHRDHADYWHTVMLWGFADALGASLWLPLLLICFSPEFYRLFHWRSLLQTAALLSGLYAVGWLTFQQNIYPLEFLPYPVLLLVATRLGFSGAVIGVNMLALISAHLSLHGSGPFSAISHLWSFRQTLLLQAYSTLAMLFVLPLSVMLVERTRFEEQLQKAYTEMEQLAALDPLTGLANRRRFNHALHTEWVRAARDASTLALLMIDADCFKAYNDRYGHLAGDECLRHIAKALLSEPLRPYDVVARYGGEEFAILLPGAAVTAAHEVAENIRLRLAAENLLHEGNPFGCVTVSIGCASFIPTERLASEQLIAAADQALYQAKESGRNCVHVAASPLPERFAV